MTMPNGKRIRSWKCEALAAIIFLSALVACGAILSKVYRRLAKEDGPELNDPQATALMTQEIKVPVPLSFHALRARIDITDGGPTWGIYAIAPEDIDALKQAIAESYRARKIKYSVDNVDHRHPNGSLVEPWQGLNPPDWWSPKQLPDPDVLAITSEGTWTYCVFSHQQGRCFFHHSTW
jgi:hypothetical protein